MKKIMLILISLIAGLLILYSVYFPRVYENNYFEEIGIKGAWLYRNVVADKGNPLNIEINDGRYYVHYDGLVLIYDDIKKDIIQSARIVGEQYRFGFWRIGIGTSRKKIESVYKNVRKIIDLPEDEFGVIDGDMRVYFNFDEKGFVSKITLTDGI